MKLQRHRPSKIGPNYRTYALLSAYFGQKNMQQQQHEALAKILHFMWKKLILFSILFVVDVSKFGQHSIYIKSYMTRREGGEEKRDITCENLW